MSGSKEKRLYEYHKALNNIDLLFIQRTYWLVTTNSLQVAMTRQTLELPSFFLNVRVELGRLSVVRRSSYSSKVD